MIIMRCANGVVAFQIERDRKNNSIIWHCVNDGTSDTEQRTPLGYQQLLASMTQKAVTLKGSLQQVIDMPSIQ